MKKNIIIISALVLLLGSSCKKDFLSVNEKNPNAASEVTAKLVLPAALNASAATINNSDRFNFVYLWHGLWSISGGYSQPNDLTQYNLRNTSYEGNWTEFYINGENYTYIEKNSTDAKLVNYLAIAKIMKAWIFQNLVDAYGDVPYSEAFQAPAILKPKYDKQQDIYENLVVSIDDAIALLKGASVDAEDPGVNDIMFKGDMGMWIKFANTLKLRILMHQSDMTGRSSYISGALATTVADGFLGAGESAAVNPGYIQSTGKMNPFYENYYNADGSTAADGISYTVAGEDGIEFYASNNDARLEYFYAPASSDGSFAGNYFGDLVENLLAPNKTSQLGAGMIGTFDRSSFILSDIESLLLQAEAAEKGLITGSAKDLYNSAVTQSFVYFGIADSTITQYLTQENANVNYDVATNKLKLIMTQKWASLNGIAPMEIWTDYRRSGYPTFIHFAQDVNRKSDTPPVRLLYPQREIGLNGGSVAAAGTINPFTSKIFWQSR
jgi:hypothetical protein